MQKALFPFNFLQLQKAIWINIFSHTCFLVQSLVHINLSTCWTPYKCERWYWKCFSLLFILCPPERASSSWQVRQFVWWDFLFIFFHLCTIFSSLFPMKMFSKQPKHRTVASRSTPTGITGIMWTNSCFSFHATPRQIIQSEWLS